MRYLKMRMKGTAKYYSIIADSKKIKFKYILGNDTLALIQKKPPK